MQPPEHDPLAGLDGTGRAGGPLLCRYLRLKGNRRKRDTVLCKFLVNISPPLDLIFPKNRFPAQSEKKEWSSQLNKLT